MKRQTLTRAEKTEIIRLLEADLPLPRKYRESLFADPPKPVISPGIMKSVERRGLADGWANTLIHADNLDVLASLAGGSLRDMVHDAGGMKLVYIDPPFEAGLDFRMDMPVGDNGEFLRQTAFEDKWNPGAFDEFIYPRLELIHNILADDGCLYAHCDWRLAPRMRIMLDRVFGNFVNEIIWHYTGGGRSRKYFARKHDHILVYSKSRQFRFNADAIRIPYKKGSGYARSGITAKSGKKYMPNQAGTVPDDVWDIPIINPMSSERTGYPTQKPESLLWRIISASSMEGDLVADFFCGSGTTIAVAEKLRRKWLAVDCGPLAIHTCRKRLLELQNYSPASPFQICVANEFQQDAPGGGIKAVLHYEAGGVRVELAGFSPKAGEHPRIDLVDYWAVDPEYESHQETFHIGWHSFRTKNSRPLVLSSPVFCLAPGTRAIAVMIVDIRGQEYLEIFIVSV